MLRFHYSWFDEWFDPSQSANCEGDIRSLNETKRSRLAGGANKWQADVPGAGERRGLGQRAEIVTPDQQWQLELAQHVKWPEDRNRAP